MNRKQFKILKQEEDTITAISTPLGSGGIGIIRISGPKSIDIVSRIFLYQGKIKKKAADFDSHKIYYGTIVEGEKNVLVDEVLLSIMRKPKTYTREDIVEINCHSSYLIMNKILAMVCQLGARIAQPGEFTRLAFLSGRIDLSQAEAIIDIIQSSNEKSLQSSLLQLSGGLKTKINEIKKRLIDLEIRIEASLDFPDQGIIEVENQEIIGVLTESLLEIKELLDTAKYGQIIKEGINTIILGKTNVGKSSLFNMLLKKNRSIVTPIPGTTRDLIESSINIRGFTFNLADTAGMKNPENEVEKISLERVYQQMEYSQIFIILFDQSKPLDIYDFNLIKQLELSNNRNIKKIIVLNKTDLPSKIEEKELLQRLGEAKLLKISVKNKTGIEKLVQEMISKGLSQVNIPEEGLIINNKRHIECFLKVRDCLQDLLLNLRDGIEDDFVAMDLKYIINLLSSITGDSYDNEILNQIFSRFCIGK